jgi:hypothetical protein
MQHPTQTRDEIPTLALRMAVTVLAVAGACACDKAKAGYEECLALEAEWKMVEAREACRAAASADPDSKSGKAAQAKLPALDVEAEKILLEQKKQKGFCPSGKFVTRCLYKGTPRPTRIEEQTEATCNQEAHQTSLVDGMTCPVCECVDFWKEPYENLESE